MSPAAFRLLLRWKALYKVCFSDVILSDIKGNTKSPYGSGKVWESFGET